MKPCERLIVGAGPAGLTLAIRLLQTGLSLRIVDAARDDASFSRATGIQPRVMKILDELGVAGPVTETAIELRGKRTYLNGALRRSVSFWDDRTHRYGLSVDQSDLQRFLMGKVSAAGASIEWETRVASVKTEGLFFKVTIQGHDGSTSEILTRQIIGCDGGRSRVRQDLHIPFPGETYDDIAFYSECELDTTLDHNFAHFFVSQTSRLVFVPVPGSGRFR